MVVVIKRDGSKEEFIKEKVVVSCLKAGATLEAARAIADEVEKRVSGLEAISSRELRSMVLELLRARNEEWYENWLTYDRAVKRRVEG